MARPRGYAAEAARDDFRKELEHCMLDVCIGSKKELAVRCGIDPRTMYRRFEDITKMDISDLAILREVLNPDPIKLLKAIGYPQKDIDRAYHLTQAINR